MGGQAQQQKVMVSPVGSALYPRLEEPDTKFKESGEYSVKLIVAEAEAKPLMDLIDQTLEGEYQTAVKTAKPGTRVKRADPPYVVTDGQVYFSFRSGAKYLNRKTGQEVVVTIPRKDSAKNDLPASVRIGGGSTIKVAFRLNPYCTPALGAGVGLRLHSVQVLDLVPYVPGGDVFDAVEGGYTADADAPGTNAGVVNEEEF